MFGKKEEIDFSGRIEEIYEKNPKSILRVEFSSKTRAIIHATRIGEGWIDAIKDNKEEVTINTGEIIEFRDVTNSPESYPHPAREKDNA